MEGGITEELCGLDLGDARLEKRSRRVLEALAVDPQASVNASFTRWSDTLAAYRLFDNAAVTPEQILEPHAAATLRRAREHPLILVVQDTTELDYSTHPPQDAGYLNREQRRGLYEHVQLAVTPERLCLGVLGMEFFDRSLESLGRSAERKTLPIEAKESYRWLQGYRFACEVAAACPQTRVVSVADREGDIYDIFVECQQHDAPRADYLIRAQEDRCTPERDPASGPSVYRKVADEVRHAPCLATRTIELERTAGRAARTAHLEIRAMTIEVKPPHARGHLPSITHQVVLAEEVGGPGDGTDVCWLLLTTLPIERADQVLRILDCYVARWTVEVFFRTLKTGCRVEELQLETNGRLKNCLAFYHIIAWRVLYLTQLNRTTPTLPCDQVFDDCEWKSVWSVVAKKPLPERPPELSRFLQLLAELGGHNRRRRDPPPGPQPLWIGLRRMSDFATAWLTFGPKT